MKRHTLTAGPPRTPGPHPRSRWLRVTLATLCLVLLAAASCAPGFDPVSNGTPQNATHSDDIGAARSMTPCEIRMKYVSGRQ